MNVYDPWYEDKLKLSSASSPPFGGYAPLPAVIEDGSFTFLPEEKPKNTEELLMEFDYVYDSVELNHLTPPQTPPQSVAAVSGGVCVPIPGLQNVLMQQQSQPQQFQLSYVPQLNQQQQPMHQQQQLSFLNPSDYYTVNEYVTAVQTPQQQQQQPEPPQQVPGFVGAEYGLGGTTGFSPQQMEEVMQDIVRSAAEAETLLQLEQLVGNDEEEDEDDEDSCGFSETGSIDSDRCSSAVSRSPAYSDSADSSYYGSSSYGTGAPEDDEDWSPAKSKKLNLSSNAGGGGSVSKKRTRPHGRGTEDKKSRKKEQNKNAATRYRQKKKAEIEEILIEESKLRERHDELKSKSADLGREVRCLKKLMRELCQAKGLI
ncbi:cyclic AMP-dependent transcription factor ATF-4 isoform X2 [Anopheles cruzii]|uniref:cyclic AMP-dependent transcription factor ATF-4 isoform X2 n=1 Tax=Anopheles cruzii TaxID=68878 RepID=UPI0022EC2A1A|nr:cyclic AMP-dependent transcription factor ATF-4 isoform X2 [Anopheles cruzii]